MSFSYLAQQCYGKFAVFSIASCYLHRPTLLFLCTPLDLTYFAVIHGIHGIYVDPGVLINENV